MQDYQNLYVNGQRYDIVLRNNEVFRSFMYNAFEKTFIKGKDKVQQWDVSMYIKV